MKKLVVLGILLVAFAATASAQTDRPIAFYAGGGIGIPLSPDLIKDNYKVGFHGKLAAGYNPPTIPGFEVMVKFEYHAFGLDVEGAEGGDFVPMLVGADAKYAFGLPAAPIKPYIFGGPGLSMWEFNDTGMDMQTDFYLNFGAGVQFKAGEAFGVFVEGRYATILAEGDAIAFIPITAGFRF